MYVPVCIYIHKYIYIYIYIYVCVCVCVSLLETHKIIWSKISKMTITCIGVVEVFLHLYFYVEENRFT